MAIDEPKNYIVGCIALEGWGWRCPYCKHIYSPHVQTCENCNPQQERTNKDQSALTNQLLNESKN